MSRKTRTQPAHVWVVEALWDDNRWEAVRLCTNREQGRGLIDYLSSRGEKYRLRKYVREEPS